MKRQAQNIADQLSTIYSANRDAKAGLDMAIYQSKPLGSEETDLIVYEAMNNITTELNHLWQKEKEVDPEMRTAIDEFIGALSPVMVKSYGDTAYYYYTGASEIFKALYDLQDKAQPMAGVAHLKKALDYFSSGS